MIEMSSGSLPLTVAFVVASVVALLAATAAAVTDVATRRLPNRLVGVTALGSVVASATVDVVSWWRAGVVVVAVFAGPLLVVRLVAPATIGAVT
ncbi:MAG: hypothetical protein RLZZ01_469 [Actinomycetota bacterium]